MVINLPLRVATRILSPAMTGLGVERLADGMAPTDAARGPFEPQDFVVGRVDHQRVAARLGARAAWAGTTAPADWRRSRPIAARARGRWRRRARRRRRRPPPARSGRPTSGTLVLVSHWASVTLRSAAVSTSPAAGGFASETVFTKPCCASETASSVFFSRASSAKSGY